MTDTPDVDASKVLVENRDHVLVLTLNRPEARNAVDGDVWFLIGDALEKAQDDPEVRCIVLTGAGDLAFSAGLDLKALATGTLNIPPRMARYGFAGFVRHFTSKPVIAAVNGKALGGGTELALACDLIVACESASFGLPEVKRGLIAGGGGVFRITEVIPRKIALELLMTGEPISATEAARWGLVNRVVPDGTALDGALALAAEIAKNAPLAVQASKRLAYRIVDGEPEGEARMWAENDQEIGGVFASADAQEGPRAFAEKRDPIWQGK
ncbi:crotonase/enoyl-CoA hydratase family protein [Marmoricola sp. RAF53]|uniref:crotonase/enoyl-CoA hydratase family protein n=1 Tax=Marmoricola sp. RAF53 TaxID=3233059 RepID=UPI003F9A6496